MLALAAAQAGGVAETSASERIQSHSGYIADSDPGGDDWVRLSGLLARLLIPGGGEREAYWAVIDAAGERNVALSVRFDAAAGRLGAGDAYMVYPLCSIAADNGASLGDEARNCPAAAAGAEGEAERLLALGAARVELDPAAARPILARALATPGLRPRAQVLVLQLQGAAAQALAFDLDPADPAYDRMWAEALAAYRQAMLGLPDHPGPRIAATEALVELGGYEDALALYREVERRWPERAFDVAVGVGAVYRNQGDYRRALGRLDDYARSHGPDAAGMRFHYHRAWTLALLGRDAEAERQVGEGLAAQPDFPSAYLLRSCVRARLGRPDEALADQRRAVALLGDTITRPTAAGAIELERGRRMIALLEQAVAARRRGPLAEPCAGHWERWVRPRQRSALLGPG